jgi:hypothetical protein
MSNTGRAGPFGPCRRADDSFRTENLTFRLISEPSVDNREIRHGSVLSPRGPSASLSGLWFRPPHGPGTQNRDCSETLIESATYARRGAVCPSAARRERIR